MTNSKNRLLLALDVGNTNTVIGVFREKELVAHWRIRTIREATGDELGIFFTSLLMSREIDISSINDMIISSVVPPMQATLLELSRKYFRLNPILVGPGIKTGMPILYDNPKEVGADRIVNAVAAYEKYQRSLIIVDFGTATTFDYISSKGEYCGGAIAPGMMISCEALFQKASKLPRVEIFTRTNRIIAKDTISSMNVGILYGYAGLVDNIVRKISEEAGSSPKVIATGGLASLISPISETIEVVEENLTLEGLRSIYEKNKPKA